MECVCVNITRCLNIYIYVLILLVLNNFGCVYDSIVTKDILERPYAYNIAFMGSRNHTQLGCKIHEHKHREQLLQDHECVYTLPYGHSPSHEKGMSLVASSSPQLFLFIYPPDLPLLFYFLLCALSDYHSPLISFIPPPIFFYA